jgi:chromatin segregation and condensation protein Rec8/ScpA/Scc1 (kleisin family)
LNFGLQNFLLIDMDYSNLEENIKASEEADFQYAKWYEKQSDERKSAMMISGYKLVAERIKAQQKAKNPFSTKADVILHFMEVTQKEAYPQDVFTSMVENMKKRSDVEWQQRFDDMKNELGWSFEDIANFTDSENPIDLKESVSQKIPAFAKLAVCVFEQMKNSKSVK